jgi:2,3-bisphosphoglycerate-dependent phosphoglycerate mutase
MKKYTALLLLWAIIAACQSPQQKPDEEAVSKGLDALPTTTLILVRHAEKTGTEDDAGLTEAGHERANLLAHKLEKVPVDALFSTPYNRTRLTLTPLAQAKNLEIDNYIPHDEGFVPFVLENYSGKTVVISGHSNTIPSLVNTLTGTTQYPHLDDQDYDTWFIVFLAGGSSRVLEMK